MTHLQADCCAAVVIINLKQLGQAKADKSLLSNLAHGQKFDVNELGKYAGATATPTKREMATLLSDFKHLLKQASNAKLQARVAADASKLETNAFGGEQTLSEFATFATSGAEIDPLNAIASAYAADASIGSDVTADLARVQAVLSKIQSDGAAFRSGIVTLVADAQPAVPGAVTFSDSTFLDSDWTAAQTSSTTTQASFSAGQVASGGNPDAYRSVTLNWLNDTSSSAIPAIFVASLNSQAMYNPSTSGAIASISYSMDAKETSADNTAGVFEELVLYQNGHYYVPAPNQFVTNTGVWTAIGQSGLVASDFNAPLAPPIDLSAQGGPIEFGYMSITGNSSVPAGQHQNIVGTDNWSVTVNPV